MGDEFLPLSGGRLTHIFITVRDLSRSLEFYVDKLGFHVRHEVAGSCAFIELPHTQGLRLALYAESASWADTEPAHTQRRLVMVDVTSVSEASRRLAELGVAVSGIFEVPYGIACKFADPDGNVIELHEPQTHPQSHR